MSAINLYHKNSCFCLFWLVKPGNWFTSRFFFANQSGRGSSNIDINVKNGKISDCG